MIDSIICVLDDCLISVYNNKNKYPCGIWDYKIIWPIWNILKNYQEKRKKVDSNFQLKLAVISNNDCIKKGITKDISYWSKISFISHALEDYVGLPSYGVESDYSLEANWKNYLSKKLLAIDSVIKDKTLFIGVNQDDFEHSKNIGVNNYITTNNLINLNYEDRDRLFQGGSSNGREQQQEEQCRDEKENKRN